jgi:putative glycosyltransferase (TIGR04372 family)
MEETIYSKVKSENPLKLPYALLLNFTGLILVGCLYILKPFKKIILVNIVYPRIGHLACNTDLFLRRLQLGIKKKDNILYIGVSSVPCNHQLLKMFSRILPIVQSPFFYQITRSYVVRKSKFYEDLSIFMSNDYFEFNNSLVNLFFTEKEEKKGKEILKKLSIEDNDWFVCFHSRDSAYLLDSERKADYRDSDVNSYLKAVEYVVSCGGFAIRMGSAVEKPIPTTDRIIDYATYHRTDFGDIYLSAKCKFFLGSTSGLHLVSTIFHVPVACANFIPLEYAPVRSDNLFIPKKIWSNEKRRLLTFREILEFGVGKFQDTKEYESAGLVPVENTAEEIFELAREMNERLDGVWKTTEEDEELQKKYWSLFRPSHICYSAPSRVGAVFLRKNKELLK